MTEQDGLDILVVTDHARISMAWRMSPYWNLLRVEFDQRSVFQVDVERYRSAISAANRAHPRVLIIPGIEATANHYFTGCCGRTSPRCNRAGCMSSGDFRSIGYVLDQFDNLARDSESEGIIGRNGSNGNSAGSPPAMRAPGTSRSS